MCKEKSPHIFHGYVPYEHRSRFIDAIAELPVKLSESVLAFLQQEDLLKFHDFLEYVNKLYSEKLLHTKEPCDKIPCHFSVYCDYSDLADRCMVELISDILARIGKLNGIYYPLAYVEPNKEYNPSYYDAVVRPIFNTSITK